MATSNQIVVTVRLFAAARDYAQAEAVDVALEEPATIADLKRELAERYAGLRPLMDHSMLAVGTRYARDSERLKDGAAVALIPPVSGG